METKLYSIPCLNLCLVRDGSKLKMLAQMFVRHEKKTQPFPIAQLCIFVLLMRLIKAVVVNCSRSIKVRFNTIMVVDGARCLGKSVAKMMILILA